MTPGTFVLGLVESFLYGVYAGLVFTPIHDLAARRAAPPITPPGKK